MTSDRIWPNHHGVIPDGQPLVGDEISDHLIGNLYVRCYACEGRAHPECECGGTGFDWSDTCDARAVLRRAQAKSAPAAAPDTDEGPA